MYSIYYWGKCEKFWGRVLPIAMALELGGKDYEVLERDEAPAEGVFAVPVVTFPNGVTMSQTTAILDVIGEECELGGTTPAEKMKCKQSLLDLADVFGELSAGKLVGERLEKWLKVLDYNLADGFFAGKTLTVADLFGVFVFHTLVNKGVDFKAHANVAKWNDDVKKVPVVKAKIESGVPIMPS